MLASQKLALHSNQEGEITSIPPLPRPQQMKLLTDESLHINLVSQDITDSNMEDANEETSIIDSDEEIDEI